MKIIASELDLSSSHVRSVRQTVHERLRIETDRRPAALPATLPGDGGVRVAVSDAARARQSQDAGDAESGDVRTNDPALDILIALTEAITGRRVRIFDGRALTPVAAAGDDLPTGEAAAAGFTVDYRRSESYDESESTRVAARGSVLTATGEVLAFSLDIEMARSFHSESEFALQVGNARRKDPLVINLAGVAADLSGQPFRIDLDADGSIEAAHFVGAGSGFVVIDRNGNGRIDDGREMFGAITGDGFEELARLDEDGNGWLDEADAAFAKLLVWTRTDAGEDRLTTLAANGVGALGLARLATPFEIRTAANASLGAVRSSGVYLGEDGRAGSLQQIDLTV